MAATRTTGLPHGSVPFHFIQDQQAREAVMKLNENILWLARQMSYGGISASAGKGKSDVVVPAATTANKAKTAAAAGVSDLARGIPIGSVTSNSRTVMTAEVPGVTELKDGVVMWLMNNNKQTSNTNWTLDVNGLGAKPVYQSMALASRITTTFNKAYTMLFVYNETRVEGGCWDMVYGYYTNTTYTPPKLGFGYAECDTAAATVDKVATCANYTLTAGATVAVHFVNAVPANATLKINTGSVKPIWYRGAAIVANVIQADDTVLFIYDGTAYRLLCIDRIGGGAA